MTSICCKALLRPSVPASSEFGLLSASRPPPVRMRPRVIVQVPPARLSACGHPACACAIPVIKRLLDSAGRSLFRRFCPTVLPGRSGLLPACPPVLRLPGVVLQAPRLRLPARSPLPAVPPFRMRRRVIGQSILRGLPAGVPLPAVPPVRCLRRVIRPSHPLRLRSCLIPVRHCPDALFAVLVILRLPLCAC